MTPGKTGSCSNNASTYNVNYTLSNSFFEFKRENFPTWFFIFIKSSEMVNASITFYFGKITADLLSLNLKTCTQTPFHFIFIIIFSVSVLEKVKNSIEERREKHWIEACMA